jgi:CBS domain-containing protein
MDTTVPTLSPGASVLDAIDFLLKKRVTGAPVVDDDGRLVGIFTEKDCLRIVAHAPEPQNIAGRVGDYMTRDVQTISPDMDVYYAAGLFLNVNFRRFPVVENGRLVGAITRFDILRVVRANRDFWALQLRG